MVGAVGAPDRSLWNNCKVADLLTEWTGELISRYFNLDINFLFMSGIPKTTPIFQEKLNFVKLGCALDKRILISNIFKKADFLVDSNRS